MTISNLGEFNRFIDRVTRGVMPERVQKFQQVLAIGLFRSIVLKSPVGNPDLWANPAAAPPGYVGGRFRANWQIGASPEERPLDTTQTNELAQIAAAQNLGGIGKKIWVFNNVPYAARLEDGWSRQAPLGVVNVAITEIVAANRS
jgi:hypothetical protein